MNAKILSTLTALCNRQRLLLALSFVLLLGIVLFNGLAGSVDFSGWSSGFTHPLHGGDHFLTMLAVGIWAAQLRGNAIWLLPVTFVGVMSLGGLAGAAGLFIPSAELIILLSGLVFSVFIVRKVRFSSKTNVIIVAFFAFFHGFAHGQEISTSASLISYTLGFMVATLLLHGAGILIVRLLVVIFALFISQLAYAQSSVSHLVNKATVATTQTDNTHEFFRVADPAPPDGSQERQRLDSGGHRSIAGAEVRSPLITYDEFICGSPPYSSNCGREFIRAVHSAYSDIAYAVTNTWLLSPQLGIHFLTNGVGLTSPPVASMTDDSTPRFCCTAVFYHSATHGKQVSKTTPHFDLSPAFHTLATSFLTNGVGATSPPVWCLFSVYSALNSNELVFHNSTCFNRSTALQLPVSQPLFPSISVTSKTQFNSRSPPFAFSIDPQCWSSSFTKHLNII
jgi:hydrogenase/urease accessory protein HupE